MELSLSLAQLGSHLFVLIIKQGDVQDASGLLFI